MHYTFTTRRGRCCTVLPMRTKLRGHVRLFCGHLPQVKRDLFLLTYENSLIKIDCWQLLDITFYLVSPGDKHTFSHLPVRLTLLHHTATNTPSYVLKSHVTMTHILSGGGAFLEWRWHPEGCGAEEIEEDLINTGALFPPWASEGRWIGKVSRGNVPVKHMEGRGWCTGHTRGQGC